MSKPPDRLEEKVAGISSTRTRSSRPSDGAGPCLERLRFQLAAQACVGIAITRSAAARSASARALHRLINAGSSARMISPATLTSSPANSVLLCQADCGATFRRIPTGHSDRAVQIRHVHVSPGDCARALSRRSSRPCALRGCRPLHENPRWQPRGRSRNRLPAAAAR